MQDMFLHCSKVAVQQFYLRLVSFYQFFVSVFCVDNGTKGVTHFPPKLLDTLLFVLFDTVPSTTFTDQY